MVLGVCRFVLKQEADAEDAFQATFLALARKGGSIQNRAILSAWLREVAYRVALKVRVKAVRRRTIEKQSMSMLPAQFAPDRQHHEAAWNDLRPVLHDEVRRLPDKYRLPIVLSYLEGKTNEEVAELLHWPVGTVKGRLSRARALLHSRLTRRGVTLSAALLLVELADSEVLAEVASPELVSRTTRSVKRFRARSAAAGSTPSPDLPTIDSTSSRPRRAAFRKPTKLALVGLIFAISLVAIFAVPGIGSAFAGSGNLPYLYLRYALPAGVFGGGGGHCH